MRCKVFHPMRSSRLLLIFALALALVLGAHAEVPTNGWTLVWNDEFDGTTLDTTKWGYWLTGARREAINTPSAIAVGGGNMTLSTYTSGGTHYTGMISTSATYLPAYGYIEARIDYNDTAGMWSAFWLQSPTMGATIGDGEGSGTEMDVCEHRSVDGSAADISNKVVGNIHWDGYGASHKSVGYDSGSLGLASGFHVYGMEWTPTTQRFYIDGVLKWTVTDASTSPVSQRTQFLILSSEVDDSSTTWAGTIPAAGYGTLQTTTTKMIVDYVRVYQRAETAVNGDLEARTAPWYQVNQASLAAGQGRNSSQGVRVNPNTTAGSSFEQGICGLLPATDYVFTGWANAAATTWAPIRIGVKNHGNAQTYQAIGASSYAQATVPFTTGATNTTATVFAWQPTQWGDAYVDDFLLRRAATVNNGNLESGDAGAWTSLYGGTVVSRDGTNYGGDYALKIPSSTSAAGAEQDLVGLTPNTAYRLSGWTTNGGQGLLIGVKNHGNSQVSTTVSASAWTRGTVDFTTGASSTTATVFAYRATSTATEYADSFFLYQPLAAPWVSQDVTAIPLAGIAGTLGNRFVIQAAGADIWSTADKFHFVNQTLTGDGQITARILGLGNTNISAKTGVMMRETLNSYARSVMVDWTPGQKVEFIRRTVASGSSTSDSASDVTNAPWVRLARRGNTFNGYYSADGVTWTHVGPQLTIAMASSIFVGLPACSHDDALLTEAVLDNVSIALPPPDVAITSPAEGVTLPGVGTGLRVTAALTDIGTQGTPVVAWTKVSGPGTVTFANAALADTTATFSATGTCVLQCAATTGAGTGATRISVNVIASPDAALAVRLKFDESSGATAADASGSGRNATLVNSPAWVAGTIGNAVSLNGTTQYATLPAGIVSTAADFTMAGWVKLNTVSGWMRIFDFGTGTTNYLFLTPMAGAGGPVRFAITTGSGEQQISGSSPLAIGAWTHVAVTLSGPTGILYVNGVEVGRNSAMTLTPASLGSTTQNYLGKSQFSDPYLDGALDDVRLYRRALPAAEIATLIAGNYAATVAAGPAPAATNALAASLGGSAVNEFTGAPTAAWSKVSGPGTATFGNTASPATTVTFNQPGAYVLRLTATNSAAQDFAEIAVNVAANPNIFADWQSLTWPGVSDVNIIGPLADPDFDGTKSLLEYSLGMNAAVASTAGLPASLWRNVSGTDYLTLQVRRPIGRTGITYAAEVTGAFTGWSAAVQDGTPASNGDGTETVYFRDTVPRGTAPRFIRLKITQP